MTSLRKVAVTGPESTGKSALCKGLAEHFNTRFVPEFAREYLDKLDRPYVEEDIVSIARGQLAHEYRLAEAMKKTGEPLLFCDTELIVTKIWSLHKYHRCDPWILEKIKANPYDLYLLCDVDLAWEPDPLREHPDLRNYFFNWYRQELSDYGFPFVIVRGVQQERLNNAIVAVNNFFTAD
ncbi:MAG: ATP-binding protein [Bacteroidales bacterium]|nr:ATP-binding protein [Bacteroidales bacterium]